MNNVNHNYLPFEVTELLPKENLNFAGLYWFLNKDVEPIISNEYSNMEFRDYRDVWTILDALTYLEEQGYYLNVFVWNIRTFWDFTLFTPNSNELYRSSDYPSKYKFPEMKTRIEAYTAGIKHCLELIKHNKNGNIN